MRTLARRWAVCLALGALVLPLAGVAGASTSETQKFRGPVLKLMALGSKGNPSSDYPDIEVGAAAAARAINSRGGIGGRQVKVDFCNTNFNANDATACARQATSGGYAAVVGYHTGAVDAAVMPALEAGRIPAIGLESTGIATDLTSAASWPFQDGTVGSYLALPFAAEQMNKKRIQFVRVDVASLALTSQQMRDAASAGKLDVTFLPDIRIPLTGVTDYAPYAQQLKDSGAQTAVIAIQPGAISGLMKAAQAIGANVTWMSNGFNVDETLFRNIGSASNGTVLAVPFPPFRAAKNLKPIKQFTSEIDAEVKKSGREKDPRYYRPAGLNAWLSVYAVAAAAKQVKGTVTNESLWNALPRMKPMALANGLIVWRPAELGKSSFAPRLPGALYQFHQVQNGNIIRTKLKPASGIRKIRGQ